MSARSTQAAAEVARINTFFPLMPRMGMRWARSRPFEGMTIAVNAHLTTLTAAILRELALGGGEWVVCASNPATTDLAVVELLRSESITVETGGDLVNRHKATLARRPQLIADVGFELLDTLIRHFPESIEDVIGGVEITRTGINRLRRTALPLPVVNINDGLLKSQVENRHGVAEGLWSSLTRITGMKLSGRRVLIVGYGPVGRGLARYAKALGGVVEVAERDPIRRIVAHYDGFPTPTLVEGLRGAEVAVSATGEAKSISVDLLRGARDGLVLVNAGHGGDEIAISDLRDVAVQADQLGPLCTRYRTPMGPWLTVLGDGHPLNIVTNAGSPEPVLLHFAVMGLTLEWLAGRQLSPGEVMVPGEVEVEASRIALGALGQDAS